MNFGWQERGKFKFVSLMLVFLAVLPINAARAADDDTGLSVEDDASYRLNADATKNVKVWGGVPVPAGAYPAIVGITQAGSKQVQCTGSLIEPDIVLTAAHCVCGGITGSVVFADREGTGLSIKVAASTQHLSSCGGALTNGADIGLLLLSQKASVSPIEMQADEIVQAATRSLASAVLG
jgi:secreted trypsin-like serine protease